MPLSLAPDSPDSRTSSAPAASRSPTCSVALRREAAQQQRPQPAVFIAQSAEGLFEEAGDALVHHAPLTEHPRKAQDGAGQALGVLALPRHFFGLQKRLLGLVAVTSAVPSLAHRQ